ncbi:MAG: NAD(P)(+) transhydrogenase (Re/Si-specific) subunit beta [Oscillospiraceae bacterium]
MSNTVYYIICSVLALAVLGGIAMLSKVKTAVAGNAVCMAAMLCAVVVTLYFDGAIAMWQLYLLLAVGLLFGLIWASKVKMIEMPQVVALLNGIGGLASAIVGAVELVNEDSTVFGNTTAAIALSIGAITFFGSLIAAAKLAKVIDGKPKTLKRHRLLMNLMLFTSILAVVGTAIGINKAAALAAIALSSSLFGILFAMRVGGADMPITISLLNSLSGVAGAIAGMAIYNILLVSIGGIVGASGLLLTQIMCRAMNRSLSDILLGKTSVRVSASDAGVAVRELDSQAQQSVEAQTHANAEKMFEPGELKDVIIVPGYGMALSQAQHQVKELMTKLEANGAKVRFAIHPVAGRMPGHMNVLLCEADVDYDRLYEIDVINADFENADLVVAVGANDVLNPAARLAEGTPIYGMPILNVDKAKRIIFCNFDTKPGYAGVDNSLYSRAQGVTLLLGDAKESLQKIIDKLS